MVQIMMRQCKRKAASLLAVCLAAAMAMSCLPLTALGAEGVVEEPQASKDSPFQHPGLLHTAEGFAKMKENVDNNVSPNKETWDRLWQNTYSNPGWNPRPLEYVTRGGRDSINQLRIDVRRAYQNALIWKISGSADHGEAACRIVNAWSSTMKGLGGNADRFLAAGLQGYELANIGEIMRDHPNFDTEGLQSLLLNVFYPMNDDFMIRHNDAYIGNYWANWELANLASMISIGVFCDREDIYERALGYVKAGKGNGSIYHMMPYVFEEEGLAQWQESTRDQGHTTLGLVLCGVIFETAWNQGDDLYGISDNRFRKAVEYIVRYNSLNEEVPSAAYEWRKGRDGKGEWQPGISGASRGHWRPIYSQMYNHYVNRKGLEMPNVKKMMDNADGVYIEGEGGSSLDELGWYTLTYANLSGRTEERPIEGELSDGVYRILSDSSKKSLVVDEAGNLASAEKGTRTDEWWMIKNKGDGEYTVTNLATGKAMQVNPDGDAANDSEYFSYGTQIGTGEPDGSLAQSFAFLKENYGAFRIVPSRSYLVLVLEGNSAADNARIVQWRNDALGAYWNSDNLAQRWRVEKATEVGMDFTFDEEGAGFQTAYAEAKGNHSLRPHGDGQALSLNGTSEFLEVAAKTGKNPLAGEKSATISFEALPDAESGSENWICYAAPDKKADPASYIGIKEQNGEITVARCKDGSKDALVSAEIEAKGWHQVSVVFTETETILYINGREKARGASGASLPAILGEEGILLIGKANLGSGSYYKGQLDNFKVLGHAMTDGEALSEAASYAQVSLPELLVDFDFDGEGVISGGAAKAKGSYSLVDHDGGKALCLDGFRDYLKVTGADGKALIPGGLMKEMTVSLQVKREDGIGWLFYAAPDQGAQNVNWERYLGLLENQGVVTAQRFANQGFRLPQAEASVRANQWHYVTMVLTEEEVILYDNGEEVSREANGTPLASILGGDSILQIGKANWGIGEYFKGQIDNYKVASRAWTEAEIRAEAIKYVDKSHLQSIVDQVRTEDKEVYSQERWDAHTKAFNHANALLGSSQALQSALDAAADALAGLQAWMRLDEALYDSVPKSQEGNYTKKSWAVYEAALAKAEEMQKEGQAGQEALLAAAQDLRKAQGGLLEKSGMIAEAIAKIGAIGQVELTPAGSRRVILARQACGLLSEGELAEVTNLPVLEAAEEVTKDYLAEFTFDEEETGFMGGQAIAEGAHSIQDKALFLDGTERQWLQVTKGDGSSLLTGREELTISFGAKPESDLSNWMFYAAPNRETQKLNYETYLGAFENGGSITAERYKNQGQRSQAAEGKLDVSDWSHIALTYTKGETILYINGEEAGRVASQVPLSDIFGQEGILWIGKANWGSGEYYRGWLDDFRILGTALSPEEIEKDAASFWEKVDGKKKAQAVMEQIQAIGQVTALAGCRERIAAAREAYDALSAFEKGFVENESALVAAEQAYQELAAEQHKILAKFRLHNAEFGLKGYGAVAAAKGAPVFVEDGERGKVLSMDGTGNLWLSVAKEDGSPLLGSQEELTVSYYSKAGRTETNWPFYAAPNGNFQAGGQERYIGILENGNKATAERFLNGRQDSAVAAYEPGWNHIVVVYEENCTKAYVNGVLKSAAQNSGRLTEILGNESILQIGKANWGKGEYYKGLLDDVTIYSYALSEGEIAALEAAKDIDTSPLEAKITEAKAFCEEDYTEESYAALQKAITDAESALFAVAAEEEVTAAAQSLQAAIGQLREKEPEPPVIDKSELEGKLAEAKAIEKGNYTEESYAALQKAIETAESALSTVATEEEVTAAAQSLQAAISQLKEKEPEPPVIDKSELEGKLAEAKAIEKGNYTEESYAALQKAIETAESALSAVMTEEEVTAAAQSLQAAISQLKEKEPEPPVIDKSELEGKLAEAKAIEKGNYTEESYAALQEAIGTAESALSTVTTEEEVAAAAQSLQAAISQLKEKEPEPPKPDKKPVEALKIIPGKSALILGQSTTLTVAVTPANADNPAYKLTSSSPEVISISGSKATAKKAGIAKITAEALDGSGVSASVVLTARLKSVAKIKAAQKSDSQQVKITFGKSSGAKSYDIYRSAKKNGAYKKIGSTKTTVYVDKTAKQGKSYFYKVTAVANSSACSSQLSSQYAAVKVLASPAIKCKASKAGKVTVTWKKVPGASGYVIYTSAKKAKGFKAAKALTKGSAVKTSVKAKKNVKKLYVKARAFYLKNGKRVYGSYSKTISMKIKK